MRTLSRLLPLLALGLAGCDVALGIFLAAESRKDSGGGTPATVVTVTASMPAADEAGPVDGQFEVSRTGSTAQDLVVDFTVGGTAAPGSDYTAIAPPTVTIPMGSATATVDVFTLDDFEVESPETVVLTVQAGTGYSVGLPASATVTISSDDVPPTVTVSATDPSAAERPLDDGVFTVTRTNSFGNLVVLYTVDTTGGNAATPGSDYTALSGSVTIPDGFTSETIDVTPINDTAQEPDEFVVVDLTADAAYVLGAQTTDTVTIASEDDPFYHVFVADLADDLEAQAELNKTIASNGDPDPGVWTEVGTGQGTMEFDVGGVPSANAVLLNVIDTQHFDIDAVVLLDGTDDDAGIGKADNTIYADRIANPGNISGPPDGQVGRTQGTLANKAFFLTRFDNTFTRFRIEAWGVGSGPGTFNVEVLSTHVLGGNQTGSGAAVNSTGRTYFAFDSGIPRDIVLIQIAGDGSFQTPTTTLEDDLPGPVGTASVAIDPADDTVYVASTEPAAGIRARRFNSDMSGPIWTNTLTSDSLDRFEANSIALDSSGNAIVAGGVNWGVAFGGLGHYLQKLAKADGASWLQTPSPPAGQAGRQWFAAWASGTDSIYTAGDFTGTGSADAYTRLSDPNDAGGPPFGVPVWSVNSDGPGGLDDQGTAIGSDAAGNVYVGGFVTTATGRDIAVWKFNNTGTPLAPFPYIRNGSADGDDEVLDLVVESDGTLYAVGYTSLTGQGQDWWVAKFNPAGALVASRTYHGDVGDDRATSAMVFGNSLIVVGHETVAGPETDLLHIRFVK